MTQKGILAFSGGLDTSVVVKYLQEEHDMDVITVTVDVGQGDDAKKIAAKAKKLGVKKHYNIDATIVPVGLIGAFRAKKKKDVALDTRNINYQIWETN